MRLCSIASDRIEIERTAGCAIRIDVDWLRSRLRESLEHVSTAPMSIRVALVDDETMARLHREHLNIDSTTDVLTFPPVADDDGADLVLCVDEAARRAREYGHSIERELLLYAIHGLLHCAGFDDQDESGWQAMHAEEDRILDLIGVGATFHRSGKSNGQGGKGD